MHFIDSKCVAFLKIISLHFILSERACRTPNNENGLCIPLRDCESLYEIILNIRRSSIAQQDYLRRSQCDQNNGPWVN